VAAIASAFVGEAAYGVFRPDIVRPPNLREMSPYERAAYLAGEEVKKKPAAEIKNSALAYGVLGAALGVGLGLAAALARRDRKAGLIAALLGGLAGVIAVAGTSWIMVPLFFRFNSPESGLLYLFPTHAVIFAAAGGAGGLGFGLALRDRQQIGEAVLAGILGGILGTIVFEAALAVAFPTVRTFEPIPDERTPRLLVHFCVAVCTGLLVGFSIRERRGSKAASGS
jgi:hypothetical protein